MTKKQNFNTELDWTGNKWYQNEFLYPERTIRIATSFSGIGAAEQALKQLGLKHEIVFACDTGERYLIFNYKKLAKLAEGLDEDKKKEYAEKLLEANHPKNKSLTFDSIYSNLFVDCKNKKEKIELSKECIDILTEGMSKTEILDYVNNLYEQTGKENQVKKSYFANYDIKEEQWHNDVRFIDAEPYKGLVDLYVFGPPCQPFSKCNKERLGFEDTRGTLFGDAVEVVKACQPKVFIFENVADILNKENCWDTIKAAFEDIGYDIHWRVLNSGDYGSVQRRRRLICVGFKNKTEFLFPRPVKPQSKIIELLEDKTPGKIRMMTSKERIKYMGFGDFNQVVAEGKLSHQAGNSIVVEMFMALFKQIDITKYGVETDTDNI